MSDLDGRRELLDAPDGTSRPMPLVPIAGALETLHRKVDLLTSMCAFLLAVVVFGIIFAMFRPTGVLGSVLCGAAGGLAWYLIERHARKI